MKMKTVVALWDSIKIGGIFWNKENQACVKINDAQYLHCQIDKKGRIKRGIRDIEEKS